MVGSRSFTHVAAAALLGLLCASLFLAYWLTLPLKVVLGVVDNDSAETQIARAFTSRIQPDRHHFVVELKTFKDVGGLRDAFTSGRIDLASFSTADRIPDSAETVAILQRVRVYLIGLESADQQRKPTGQGIALVAEDPVAERLGNLVLTTIYAAHDEASKPMQAIDAAKSLQTGQVKVVAIAASDATRLMRTFMSALPVALRETVTVRPAPKPDQLQRQNPAVEPVSLKVGALWSDPVLPDEEIDTPSVTTRLMARRAVSREVVAHVMRALFALQRRMSAGTLAATQIEPPPVDRTAIFPTHAGALAYIEGDESTFLDRFGDWIYLGLFAASGVGSIYAGFIGWRNSARRRADVKRLSGLQHLIAESSSATTQQDIDALHVRYRALMDDVLSAAVRLEIDQTDLLAFMVANQIYADAMQDRAALFARLPSPKFYRLPPRPRPVVSLVEPVSKT